MFNVAYYDNYFKFRRATHKGVIEHKLYLIMLSIRQRKYILTKPTEKLYNRRALDSSYGIKCYV